jgi:hypothetical protein
MKPDLTIIAGGAPRPEAPGHSEPDADDQEQCVPLSALSMPDDQEQMTPPAVGDQVSYQVEGKVTRIEGDEAYVQPTSINGQALPDKEEETPEPSPEEADQKDYSDLQGIAQQQGMLS